MTRARISNEALDQLVSTWLDERAHGPAVDVVLDAALSRTHRTRPLPGWLLPERWLPRQLATPMASAPPASPAIMAR